MTILPPMHHASAIESSVWIFLARFLGSGAARRIDAVRRHNPFVWKILPLTIME
jgi:hypothetical protein